LVVYCFQLLLRSSLEEIRVFCVLGYSEVLRSRPQQIREFAAGTIYFTICCYLQFLFVAVINLVGRWGPMTFRQSSFCSYYRTLLVNCVTRGSVRYCTSVADYTGGHWKCHNLSIW